MKYTLTWSVLFIFTLCARCAHAADYTMPASNLVGFSALKSWQENQTVRPAPGTRSYLWKLGDRIIITDGGKKYIATVSQPLAWGPGAYVKVKNVRAYEEPKPQIEITTELEAAVSPSTGELEIKREALSLKHEMSVLAYFSQGDFSAAADSALRSGAVAGLSTYIYKGMIYDARFRAELERHRKDMAQIARRAQEDSRQMSERADADASLLSQALGDFDVALGGTLDHQLASFSRASTQHYVYQSQDPEFVQSLRDIAAVIDSAPGLDFTTTNAKQLGHGLLKQSDQFYANKAYFDAHAFRQYAMAIADLLVGLDPISGFGRSVYEAFVGRNLVTGERLSDLERGFAVLGTLSFGYGQYVARGFKGLSKVASSRLVQGSFAGALRAARSSYNAIKNQAFYFSQRLWSAEQFLARSHPDLLNAIHRKADPERYFTYVRERMGIRIEDAHHAFHEQVWSEEALDLVHQLETSGRQVGRQGAGGLSERAEKALLAQGHNAKDLDRVPKTRVNSGNDPVDQSVFYSAVTQDLGSMEAAQRVGAYSGKADFYEISRIKPGTPYVVNRAAPGEFYDVVAREMVRTPGGALQVVVPTGGTDHVKVVFLPD